MDLTWMTGLAGSASSGKIAPPKNISETESSRTTGRYAEPGSSCSAISGGGHGKSLKLKTRGVIEGCASGMYWKVDTFSGSQAFVVRVPLSDEQKFPHPSYHVTAG